jgi:radical SAM protein with 4Fe4S-binding SPASM domain
MQNAGVNIRVIVSVNGRPTTHDKSRGTPGGYDSCMVMLDGLQELGALATINILHIPGLTEQADFDHAETIAARYERPLFHSTMLRRSPWFGQADDGATIPPFDCHAGDVLAIRPNGDITACQEPRPNLIFGNLRDDELNPEKVDRIKTSIRAKECQPCGCCTVAFTHGARCLT